MTNTNVPWVNNLVPSFWSAQSNAANLPAAANVAGFYAPHNNTSGFQVAGTVENGNNRMWYRGVNAAGSGWTQVIRLDQANTWGAAQTFPTVIDADGDLRRIRGRVSDASTTLASTDVNGIVEKNGGGAYTYTLAASLGQVRDAITIVNSSTSGNITIARASGVALYRAGTNADITVTPGSMVTMIRSNTTRWIAG